MFSRFETFAQLADQPTRKKIAEALFAKVQGHEAELPPEAAPYQLERILDNPALQQLCKDNPELSEQVTEEALNYILQAEQQIAEEDPFREERDLIRHFQQEVTQKNFTAHWPATQEYLQNIYAAQEINTLFYEKKFSKAKAPRTFNTLKSHFTDRWKKLVQEKQEAYAATVREAEMQACRISLSKKLKELQQVQELIGPLTFQLGRMWGGEMPDYRKYKGFDILKHFAKLLGKDQSLQKLVAMLGRMQQAEFETETYLDVVRTTRWTTEDASSKADLVGIKESSDLSSLLPLETALLGEPDLEAVFLKKFAEQKLQTFDYRARVYAHEEIPVQRQRQKEVPKGPFILCVDTSGSMAMGNGLPEIIAKTLCFAVLRLAILEQRKCYLINFSTQIETLDLSDLRTSLEKLLGFLTMSFEGGTDVDPALEHALKLLERQDFRKADVLIISDFILGALSYEMRTKLQQAQARNTQFHSCIVWDRDSSLGSGGRNKEFVNAMDTAWVYNPTNPVEILQQLQKR